VYEDEDSGKIDVDLGLVNDVTEQLKGRGEDLVRGTTPVDNETEHSNGKFSRGTSSIFERRSSEVESTCSDRHRSLKVPFGNSKHSHTLEPN